MIIYMRIPSRMSRTHTATLPSSNTVTGHICDDCLTEQGWHNIEIRETSLKNLKQAEHFERWDESSQTFVTGLHLCRPHAIKRRWQTEQYRKNVLDVLLPINTSEESRRARMTHGRYLHAKEKRAKRLKELVQQIMHDWQNKTLEFASMKQGDRKVLSLHFNMHDTAYYIGDYRYRPDFEAWLASDLDLPLHTVHQKLFSNWLNNLGAGKIFQDYHILIKGIVKGLYQRYYGSVLNTHLDLSITFASALELSFILDTIFDGFETLKATTNKRKFRIEYAYAHKQLAYYPDFLLNGKELVEVKDSRELDTPINRVKWKALQLFCYKNGYVPKRLTELDFSQRAFTLARTISAQSVST